MKKLFFSVLISCIVFLSACNSGEEVSPSIINAEAFSTSIDENPANGDILGTLTASSNQGNINNFIITSQSVSGAVAINTLTGEISVADASAFDYEANQSISGKIKVSTEDGSEKEVDFTLTINNLDPDIHITVNKGSGPQNIPDGGNFDFGAVGGQVGYTFKIQNLGQDDLNLTGNPLVKISGDDFFLTITPGTSRISAGSETSFIANYSPSSFSTASGTIEIANDDTNESLYIINLSGSEAL